jgi:hypothetical protein
MTPTRLRWLREAATSGATPWPPIAPALTSVLDQYKMETAAERPAMSPLQLASEALFGALLAALVLWRRALDADESGEAEAAFYRRMIAALDRSLV